MTMTPVDYDDDKYILAVIDMQPRFCSSYSIIDNVVDEVKLARKRNCKVILVEFGYSRYHNDCHSHTYSAIKNACDWKNNNSVVVRKFDDDGSKEIIGAIETFGFEARTIRLVGVNRTACVIRTATGLITSYKNVRLEVVWNATNNEWPEKNELGQFSWHRHHGLKII